MRFTISYEDLSSSPAFCGARESYTPVFGGTEETSHAGVYTLLALAVSVVAYMAYDVSQFARKRARV
jgi:hypothetical protein